MGHEPKCPKDGSYVVKSVLGNFVGAEVRIVTSGMANMIGPLPQFAEFRFENPRCVGSSRPGNRDDDAIAEVQLIEHFAAVQRQSQEEGEGSHFNMRAREHRTRAPPFAQRAPPFARRAPLPRGAPFPHMAGSLSSR